MKKTNINRVWICGDLVTVYYISGKERSYFYSHGVPQTVEKFVIEHPESTDIAAMAFGYALPFMVLLDIAENGLKVKGFEQKEWGGFGYIENLDYHKWSQLEQELVEQYHINEEEKGEPTEEEPIEEEKEVREEPKGIYKAKVLMQYSPGKNGSYWHTIKNLDTWKTPSFDCEEDAEKAAREYCVKGKAYYPDNEFTKIRIFKGKEIVKEINL